MHDKFNRLLAAVAASLVILGIGLAPASPAQAAKGDCPPGYLCWWNDINYSGTRWQVTLGYINQQAGDCLVLDASRGNNQASSIYLNASLVNWSSITLFDGNGGGANRGMSYAGQSDNNMLTGAPIASFSNVMSSICGNE